jgi:hypothetical protein
MVNRQFGIFWPPKSADFRLLRKRSDDASNPVDPGSDHLSQPIGGGAIPKMDRDGDSIRPDQPG